MSLPEGYFKKALALNGPSGVGKKLSYFLATGNLKSYTGLGLMQVRRDCGVEVDGGSLIAVPSHPRQTVL